MADNLNKATLLFCHHGHESHAVLLIGEVCLHGHCYEATDLTSNNQTEEEKDIIWVHLDLYECRMEKFSPKETNPLFGSLKSNWPDPNMIGRINFKYGVSVRRSDSMTRSPWSSVDYNEPVEVKGVGKIIGYDEDDLPLLASCGCVFSVGLADKETFKAQADDEVYFKAFLHVWAP